MTIIGFLIGLVIGTVFGYMMCALCVISGECSRNEEKYGVEK